MRTAWADPARADLPGSPRLPGADRQADPSRAALCLLLVTAATDDRSTVGEVLAFVDAGPADRPFFALYMPIAGHHP
jgi:hypothetical protein